jgi:hypothetical protein
VWTFRNGKALSAHGYFSREKALEAAGVPPSGEGGDPE